VFTATVAALAMFSVSGEVAAGWAAGPGSLQVALLDALYTLDAATMDATLRVTVR
jgi:hydroxyethylthiazole kinase